jgi:hypothetical protein
MRTAMRTPYTFRKEAISELEPFDASRKDYSERELALYADALLREAGASEEAPILFQEHIEPRWRKEVRVESGTPDQTITNSLSADGQTMFNRQHPQGRKVNSEQQRKTNGASYYR